MDNWAVKVLFDADGTQELNLTGFSISCQLFTSDGAWTRATIIARNSDGKVTEKLQLSRVYYVHKTRAKNEA